MFVLTIKQKRIDVYIAFKLKTKLPIEATITFN